MTEATTAAIKTKTTKPNASTFGLPNYEIPQFDLPKMEMPEAFREFAEKSVAQTKDNYEKAKVIADEATDLLKEAYTTAATGANSYHLKVFEIARANTKTAFDYVNELFGVKSLSEFVELSTTHTRKQFETMTAQTKELTELAQKVTIEIAEPLKSSATKAFSSKSASS